MDSEHITQGLARRLVDDQFPQWSSRSIRPVVRQGVDNRTFRLGEDLLVRLPAGPWYAQQVAKEQAWLPRLAALLPLPIPQPIAKGMPTADYPYEWSIYRWLDGAPAADTVTDWRPIAGPLGEFLATLHAIDGTGGPEPGEHNFFRGAPVEVYTDETIAAIDALGRDVDGAGARAVWEAATRSVWTGPPRWFHGDVAANNLLTRDGRLAAVIDFGSSGVGDPACDTVIAWTDLEPVAHAEFRKAVDLDPATWARGRGWALWKALISQVEQLTNGDHAAAARSRAIVARVIDDHRAAERG